MSDIENNKNNDEEQLTIVQVETTTDKKIINEVNILKKLFFSIVAFIGADTAATQFMISEYLDINSMPKAVQIPTLVGMITSMVIGIDIVRKSLDDIFDDKEQLEDKKQLELKDDKNTENELKIVKVEKTNDKKVNKSVNFLRKIYYGMITLLGVSTATTPLGISAYFDIETMPKEAQILTIIGMCTSMIIGSSITYKAGAKFFEDKEDIEEKNQIESKGMNK